VELNSQLDEGRNMKRLRLVAVTVVGLSLLTPPVVIASPNGCPTAVGENCVPGPTQAPRAPQGATAVCRDGSYSFSRHRASACSKNGGVSQWLSAGPG
jgi:hypothetical protein